MRIEVDRLSERSEAFSHTYRPEELSLGEEHARLAGAATVEGSASRKGERVRLRGELRAEVELHCDRCARAITTPVAVEFDVEYVPQAAATDDQELAELQADDLTSSVYEGDALDIDELAREQLLLALPMRLLCREDCKGLCPQCGVDLNQQTCSCEHQEIDPRWSALAAMKKNSDQ